MDPTPMNSQRLPTPCLPLHRLLYLTRRGIFRLAPMVLLASLQPISSVQAAPPSSEGTDTEGGDRQTSTSAEGGSKKLTLDDTFTVEGTLEKPSAFYILRRSALDYDWARLDARLSPLVLESVQDPLF